MKFSDLSIEALDSITHGAVQIILTAIKRNGLEKTLEELQNAMGEYWKTFPEANETIYRQFLTALDEVTTKARVINELGLNRKKGDDNATS